jgi:hypothetical protein
MTESRERSACAPLTIPIVVIQTSVLPIPQYFRLPHCNLVPHSAFRIPHY